MAVDLAGRRAEKAYQLSKASQELKRDQETILAANNHGSQVGFAFVLAQD